MIKSEELAYTDRAGTKQVARMKRSGIRGISWCEPRIPLRLTQATNLIVVNGVITVIRCNNVAGRPPLGGNEMSFLTPSGGIGKGHWLRPSADDRKRIPKETRLVDNTRLCRCQRRKGAL